MKRHVLLIVSKKEKKAIPYHDKVINKLCQTVTSIDPLILDYDWFVSGSFAVNTLYAPNKNHNDLDFYFSSQADFLILKALLSQKYDSYSTDLAVTFPSINVQLVSKWFMPPEELIYTHDFTNVSVAISKDCIYTTKETNYAWFNEHLDLRNFQISKEPPATDYEKVLALQLLTNRTFKYQARYDVPLSPSYKKFLYEQKDFLKKIDRNNFATDQPPLFDYYGRPVDYDLTINRVVYNIDRILQIPQDSDTPEEIWF